jgi:hypothetical protein
MIIQLNVIRSVHTILAALSTYRRQTSRNRARSLSGPWESRSQVTSVRTDSKGKGKARAESEFDFEYYDEERPGGMSMQSPYADAFSEEDALEDMELDEIAQRLAPLRPVEAMLKALLVPPSEDEPADLGMGPVGMPTSALALAKEVFVRPGRWRSDGVGARPANAVAADTVDEAQRVLLECRFDLIRLWESMRMREILALRRVRLEEESGLLVFLSNSPPRIPPMAQCHCRNDHRPMKLTSTCLHYSFLNDLDRVTGYDYVPTDGAPRDAYPGRRYISVDAPRQMTCLKRD